VSAAAHPGTSPRGYRGRFAPSPTGQLHAGSLATALASWLDARAHGGRWLVRIEDVDRARCVAGLDTQILRQLGAVGLVADEPPLWQSARSSGYAAALERLVASGWAYPCACTRSDIERALAERGQPHRRHGELIYPGTCRNGLGGRPARAMRMRATPDLDHPDSPLILEWEDRRLGGQRQDVSHAVGDFVLRRADGDWAYQLAVVVDDALQGITDVVRGEDLADNVARQIHLQQRLGLERPRYLHTPLVLGSDGHKLSKQNGARPLDLSEPLDALRAAASVLGLAPQGADLGSWLASAVAEWSVRWIGATPR